MDKTTAAALTEHLARFMTPHRRERIRQVLEDRTRYVSLILEDVYKPQNSSATLRTCDALGIQDVHIIENGSPFSLDDEVSLGSSKWVTLHRHCGSGQNNTVACYGVLRAQGYQIVATALAGHSVPLEDIALDRKTAFVFGNEEQGLSPYAIDAADMCVRLPMYGFTQSYNISVSVGILLMYMTRKLRSQDVVWQLTDDEKAELTLEWYRKIVRAVEPIEKRFFENREGAVRAQGLRRKA